MNLQPHGDGRDVDPQFPNPPPVISDGEVTRILNEMNHGETGAADRLLAAVYADLRQLAAIKMARERPGQTLQPTSLVHEAWLRLGGGTNQKWENRAHYFGAAAEAMRRILIDNARRKRAPRHGGDQQRLNIHEIDIAAAVKDDELLEVNEALARFATVEPHKAELVKLRYFAGMNLEESAEVLGVSVPTVKRWWSYSRAWLRAEIAGSKP
jgi:RNA polymerase sigma factor (TIGR02999 family)